MNAKTNTSVNQTSNAILEHILHILGKLVHTYIIKYIYVDEDDTWLIISAATEFEICSKENRLKFYSPDQ